MNATRTRTRKTAAASGELAGTMPLSGPHAGEFIPAKKTATRRTSKAQPIKATTKKAADPMDRDFTYLQEKEPTELHEMLAETIIKRADIEISAKQVQAVLSMHPYFQRSKLNKTRSGYRALEPEIVEKRSTHMSLAHQEAAELIAKRTTKKAAAKRTTTKKSTSTKVPIRTAAKAPTTTRKTAVRRSAAKK